MPITPLMLAAQRRIEELDNFLIEGVTADGNPTGTVVVPPEEKLRRLGLINDLAINDLQSRIAYIKAQLDHHTERAIELAKVNDRLRRQQTEIDITKGWLDEAMTTVRELEYERPI